MKYASIFLIAAFAAACGSAAAQRDVVVDVYKDPTCGCCTLWVDHLKAAGFTTRVTESDEVVTLKNERGVPMRARSCHTAIVDGYVVEGHVPAADIQKMLRERPAIAGLGVPGMPIGSPGMEVPGMAAQAFDTLSFTRDGSVAVYASHNK
jgi:hypothetical protein